jgi:hypothetical protein
MFYTRLPCDSPVDGSSNEKEDPIIRSRPCLLRFFSYRNLFGAALTLWITTSVVLGWVLAQKLAEYGNHVATLLPFPSSMNHKPKSI